MYPSSAMSITKFSENPSIFSIVIKGVTGTRISRHHGIMSPYKMRKVD